MSQSLIEKNITQLDWIFFLCKLAHGWLTGAHHILITEKWNMASEGSEHATFCIYASMAFSNRKWWVLSESYMDFMQITLLRNSSAPKYMLGDTKQINEKTKYSQYFGWLSMHSFLNAVVMPCRTQGYKSHWQNYLLFPLGVTRMPIQNIQKMGDFQNNLKGE